MVSAFSICLAVFGCVSHDHAQVIRLEGSVFMGSRRIQIVLTMRKAVPRLTRCASGSVLSDLTCAAQAWTHRSRGDFFVQSCLPTRVGLELSPNEELLVYTRTTFVDTDFTDDTD